MNNIVYILVMGVLLVTGLSFCYISDQFNYISSRDYIKGVAYWRIGGFLFSIGLLMLIGCVFQFHLMPRIAK